MRNFCCSRNLQEGPDVNSLVSRKLKENRETLRNGKKSSRTPKEKTENTAASKKDGENEAQPRIVEKTNKEALSEDINNASDPSDPLLNLKITVTNKKRASPPSTSPSKRRRITSDERSVVVTNDDDENLQKSTLLDPSSKRKQRTISNKKSLSSSPSEVKNHEDSVIGADGSVAEVGVTQKPKVEIAPRCIFYPNCTKQNCPFFHPTEPCKNPVMCSFGPKCRYIHPPCKFGSWCTRPDCVYYHPKEASIDCKDGFSCSVKSTCPFRHPSEACFFSTAMPKSRLLYVLSWPSLSVWDSLSNTSVQIQS